MTTEEMLKEFDEKFVVEAETMHNKTVPAVLASPEILKQFLSEKLLQARAEERKEFVRVLEGIKKERPALIPVMHTEYKQGFDDRTRHYERHINAAIERLSK